MEELERLSAERWAKEVGEAAAKVAEPARALSPATAARCRAKLRARAVVNKRIAAASRIDLNGMD